MSAATLGPRNVIVGIHGLANKPDEATLTDWWRASITEGLRNVGVADPQFEFRMVYWAKCLYSAPVHRRPYMEFDTLYNSEPYYEADPKDLRKYCDSWIDTIRAKARGSIGSTVDALKEHLGVDSLADWLLGRLLKDLAFYYDAKRRIPDADGRPELARQVLQHELLARLRAETAAGSRILILSHSMGTIISYDLLRDLGREVGNEMRVARLATLGSPLGLPYVKGKIQLERTPRSKGDARVRTPSIVEEDWTNFADRKDPVAADIHLADDFAANAHGVQVRDDLIANDYFQMKDGERKQNHHKSYGYLRSPEVAEYVRDFLGI